MQQSLVVELIPIIQRCKKLNQSLKNDNESLTRDELKVLKETVHDMETLLCNFMTSMICSPITGRINIPNPVAYVDEATRVASLNKQLGFSNE